MLYITFLYQQAFIFFFNLWYNLDDTGLFVILGYLTATSSYIKKLSIKSKKNLMQKDYMRTKN